MTMQEVTIEIDTEGAVVVSVDGVAGKSCTAITEAIEKAIGVTTSDKKTIDYTRAETGVERKQGAR